MKNKYEYKTTAYDGYGFFTEKKSKKKLKTLKERPIPIVEG